MSKTEQKSRLEAEIDEQLDGYLEARARVRSQNGRRRRASLAAGGDVAAQVASEFEEYLRKRDEIRKASGRARRSLRDN
jgi:hypothetical protein